MTGTADYNRRIVFYSVSAVLLAVYFVYSIGLFFRVGINSDYASLVLEASDILSGNVFLKDWNLTGISFFTTDLFFFVLGTAIAGTTVYAYYAAVLLMYFILIGGALLLLKTGDKKVRPEDLLLFFPIGGFPSVYACDVLRAHTAVPAYFFLALFLKQKASNATGESQKVWRIVYLGIYTVLLTLAFAGDPIVLVMGVIPVLIVEAVGLLGASKVQRKFSGILMLLTAASVILGSFLEKAYINAGNLNKNTFLERQTFGSIDRLGDKLKIYVTSILGMFDANFFGQPLLSLQTLWYFLRTLVILFGFYVMIRTLKEFIKRERYDVLSVILTLGFLFMTALFLLSDIVVDVTSARYIGYFPVLCGVLIVRYLKLHDFLSGRTINRRIAKRSAAYAISGILILSSLTPVQFKPASGSQDALAEFLVQNGLTNGYAKFWNASHVTLLADNQTQVRAIQYDGTEMRKFNWFCKNSWYEPAFSNFIVMENSDADNNDAFGITQENVRKTIGKPSKVLTVEGYTVYVYNVDITDRIAK